MLENWKNITISKISTAVCVPPGGGHSRHINRPFHGLVLSDENFVVDYHFSDGRVLNVKEKSLFYFPKGSDYEAKGIKRGRCYAINFDADISDEPFSIPFRNIDYVLKCFNDAINKWKSQDEFSDVYVKKCLYDIIWQMIKESKKKYVPKSREALIFNAAKRIKNEFYSPYLSVSSLSKDCGMSETYFRKIFTETFGVSPKTYIINTKINFAKKLLETGDFSVLSVAAESGYSDVCLFSREFKKKTGISPREYIKNSDPSV